MSPHVLHGVMVKGETGPFHREQHQVKLSVRPDDAGIDLYPSAVGKVEHYRGSYMAQMLVPTGVHLCFPPRTYGRITGRSSTDAKLGCLARVADGVIDAGYTGELMVRLISTTSNMEQVSVFVQTLVDAKQAIAQIIPTLIFAPHLMDWDEIAAQTGRGGAGFGSTDSLPLALPEPTVSGVIVCEHKGDHVSTGDMFHPWKCATCGKQMTNDEATAAIRAALLP